MRRLSEAFLVAHTTLLEITYHSSYLFYCIFITIDDLLLIIYTGGKPRNYHEAASSCIHKVQMYIDGGLNQILGILQ